MIICFMYLLLNVVLSFHDQDVRDSKASLSNDEHSKSAHVKDSSTHSKSTHSKDTGGHSRSSETKDIQSYVKTSDRNGIDGLGKSSHNDKPHTKGTGQSTHSKGSSKSTHIIGTGKSSKSKGSGDVGITNKVAHGKHWVNTGIESSQEKGTDCYCSHRYIFNLNI